MIRISYPMRGDTPLYPGTAPLRITADKSIARGDSSNTSFFSFSSHSTTHIDVPRHFCQNGYPVSALAGDSIDFFPAYCLDIPKSDDECISAGDIEPLSSDISDARALLVRTGYSRYRFCDATRYTSRHPWVHPDLPPMLRKTFPHLELVGFDLLSISVPDHRTEGRLCHRAFLCTDNPILLMEDADLSGSLAMHSRYHLWIHPWIIEDVDGVPVVAFVTET